MSARKPPPHRSLPLGDTDPFRPTPQRPVRLRARTVPTDAHFEPHQHAWAQLAYCASGVLRVTAQRNPLGHDEVSYWVPPSRAVWIAPGARHDIHVLEAAQFRTLYLHPSVTPAGWGDCRVLVVSSLLRELVAAFDFSAEGDATGRESRLSALVLDEITHAPTQALGVPLPHPQRGDKRLRSLCETLLHQPAQRITLADWARDVGASERTLSRLFQHELGMSFAQWRQQAVLAHALPLLARGMPVSHVAAASGYASDSAFCAMFKIAMGQPPGAFLSKNRLSPL